MHNNIMAAVQKDRPTNAWNQKFSKDGDHVSYFKLLQQQKSNPAIQQHQQLKQCTVMPWEYGNLLSEMEKSMESITHRIEEDSDPKQAQRDKGYAKEFGAPLAKYIKEALQTYQQQPSKLLKRPRTRLKNHQPKVVQYNGIQCFNYKGFGHYAKECRKPKRVKDYSYHKEKMMMCKQAEHGVPLQAEQADWLADMDEEIDEQELEAHYSFMAK
ncbi:retrovirus-related pol polyprotein from transposon TNT 1-94 [Tanacetum coccineum]|uniref:Retrovirus-related pol polyprotein from transposon TNT 1-94 n=1 Tax=Tanacetum coccineum TaxID=301880 RepID=A0ABQ4YH83_9ASTR